MDGISLGWCPDIPDLRDSLIVDRSDAVLPIRMDLRDIALSRPSEEKDGSMQMSCAVSTLKMLDWQFRKWRGRRIDANAEFLHQLAVKTKGHSGQALGDVGEIGLRSILKTLKRFGAPPQALCRGNSSQRMLERPELFGYSDTFEEMQYIRLDSPWHDSQHSLDVMRNWLAHGNPFLLGFAVPHNVSQYSPIIPLDIQRGGTLGGTACVVMGFDDEIQLFGQVNVAHTNLIEHIDTGAFLIQTCWDSSWHQPMWLPYAFVETRFACDAWAIKFDSH